MKNRDFRGSVQPQNDRKTGERRMQQRNITDRSELNKIREKLEKNLSAARYQHTLGVAYTAACLAMRYGEDPLAAELAGLLHDCAKEYRTKELLALGKSFGYHFSEDELRVPQVLHAVIGPYVAQEKYNVNAPEVLAAIRWHTTGTGNMSLLEKIIFTADYIEPNRDQAENLEEIRMLAFSDLSYCVFRITEDTLKYLEQKGITADPMTQQCYLWLKENGTHDNTGNC